MLEELGPLPDEPPARAGSANTDAGRARELFEKLEAMLEHINPECVELLVELRALPGTGELARQIEEYDFESAARTLEKLKKDWM